MRNPHNCQKFPTGSINFILKDLLSQIIREIHYKKTYERESRRKFTSERENFETWREGGDWVPGKRNMAQGTVVFFQYLEKTIVI